MSMSDAIRDLRFRISAAFDNESFTQAKLAADSVKESIEGIQAAADSVHSATGAAGKGASVALGSAHQSATQLATGMNQLSNASKEVHAGLDGVNAGAQGLGATVSQLPQILNLLGAAAATAFAKGAYQTALSTAQIHDQIRILFDTQDEFEGFEKKLKDISAGVKGIFGQTDLMNAVNYAVNTLNIPMDQLQKALPNVAHLAAATGQSMEGLLGKVRAGAMGGRVNALRGLLDVNEMKSLTEELKGIQDPMQRMDLVMNRIARSTKGANIPINDSFAAYQRFKKSIGDVREKIGEALIPVFTFFAKIATVVFKIIANAPGVIYVLTAALIALTAAMSVKSVMWTYNMAIRAITMALGEQTVAANLAWIANARLTAGFAFSKLAAAIPIIGAVADAIEGAIAGIGVALDAVGIGEILMIIAAVVALGMAFMDLFNGVKSGHSAVADAIASVAQFLGFAVTGSDILKGFGDAIKWIQDQFAAFAKMLSDAVGPSLQSAGKSIGQAFKAIGDTIHSLMPILNVLIQIIGGALILNFVAWSVVIKFVAQTIAKLAGVIAGIAQIIAGVVNVIANAIKLIIGILTLNPAMIKEAWQGLIGGLGDIVGGLWSVVKNVFGWIVDLLSGIGELILAPFKLVLSWLFGNFKLGEWFSGIAKSIVDGIASIPTKLVDIAKGIFSILIWPFQQVLNFLGINFDILGTVENVFNSIVDFISSIPGRIFSFITSIPQMFIDGFQSVLDWIGANFNLGKVLGDVVGGIIGFISNPIKAVAGFIGDHFIGKSPPPLGPLNQLDTVGQNMAEVMAQSMSAAKPVLAGAAGGMAATIQGAIKGLGGAAAAIDGTITTGINAVGNVLGAGNIIPQDTKDTGRSSGTKSTSKAIEVNLTYSPNFNFPNVANKKDAAEVVGVIDPKNRAMVEKVLVETLSGVIHEPTYDDHGQGA